MKKKEGLAYQRLYEKLGLILIILALLISIHGDAGLSTAILGIVGFIMYTYQELKEM